MKKIILAAVAAFALASCTTYNPIAINGEIGPKKGQATGTSLFGGLINFGDNTILAAAESSSITRVSTVDEKVVNILCGFVVTRTTIISGE